MPDPSYTPNPADVELVAAAIWSDDWPDGQPWATAAASEPEYRENAHAVLSALAAAGRLVPADAETRTEFAVRWPGIDRDLADLRPAPEGGARATVGGNPGTELYRRTVSTWPDGSMWVGPWLPVPTDTCATKEEA